jgi:hypothetical protein
MVTSVSKVVQSIQAAKVFSLKQVAFSVPNPHRRQKPNFAKFQANQLQHKEVGD